MREVGLSVPETAELPGGPTARWIAVLAGIVLCGIVAQRLCFADIPLNDNESVGAALGDDLLHGARLYQDAIDVKPPGWIVLHAVAQAVVGRSDDAVRWLVAVSAATTTVFLALVGMRGFSPAAGLAAAASYAVLSLAYHTQSWTANADLLCQPFIAAAAWAVLRSSPGARNLWTAGALLLAASCIKQTAAILWFGLFAWCAVRRDGRGAAWLASGSAAAGIAVWAAAGAPDLLATLRWGIAANFTHIGGEWGPHDAVQIRQRLELWRQVAVDHCAAIVAPLFFAATTAGSRSRARGLVFMWILLSVAELVVGNVRHSYWFHHLLPPLCVALGVAIVSPLASRVQVIGRLALVVMNVATWSRTIPIYWQPDGLRVLDVAYLRDFRTGMGVGAKILAVSGPGASLLVVGNHPEIYWYSRAHHATPFLLHWFLETFPDERARWDLALLRDPPEWVAVVAEERGSHSAFLRALLRNGYRSGVSFSGRQKVDLWHRVGPLEPRPGH